MAGWGLCTPVTHASGVACSPRGHVGEDAHLLPVPDVSANVGLHNALLCLGTAKRYRLVYSFYLQCSTPFIRPLLVAAYIEQNRDASFGSTVPSLPSEEEVNVVRHVTMPINDAHCMDTAADSGRCHAMTHSEFFSAGCTKETHSVGLELSSQAIQGLSILGHDEEPCGALVQAVHYPRPDDAILPAGIPVLIWHPCRGGAQVLMVICKACSVNTCHMMSALRQPAARMAVRCKLGSCRCSRHPTAWYTSAHCSPREQGKFRPR